MKNSPPRWADRFLKWYCRPELFESIQGDAYELYSRRARQSKSLADLVFVWNVIRFFRWRNIRSTRQTSFPQVTLAMIENTIVVAFRNFIRKPGPSLLQMIGLSAGFTSAFLIFVWIAHEFSYDRFHRDGDRIFHVISHVASDESTQTFNLASAGIDVSSVPEIEKIVSMYSSDRWPSELCFRGNEKDEDCFYFNGVFSTPSLFEVFTFPIIQGDPHPLRRPADIAVSEKMALQLFGTTNAIGRPLKVDGMYEVTVTSVFADIPGTSSIKFDFAMPFDVLRKEWGVNKDYLAKQFFFNTYIRAQAGTSSELVTKKLNGPGVLIGDLKNDGVRYEAFPIADWRLHSKFENGKNTGGKIEYIRLFAVIALLVVIMAIINFINLTTARASTRAKEIGIRKVTGAFRSGIIVQFMVESLLMVALAMTIALVAAQLIMPAFGKMIGENIAIKFWQGMLPVYGIAFLLIVSFASGIYPAFVLSSFQPARILKSKYNGPAGSNSLRKFLLTVQLSVSLGIIVFSGILYLQLNFIVHKDLGFDRQNTIRLEPTINILNKLDAFKTELSKTPAIVGVASSNQNPLQSGGGNTGVTWPGKATSSRLAFATLGVTYEFPELFGLKVTDGRTFLPQPRDSVNSEVLVSEEAVRTMGLAHPIGEHITIGGSECVIIGVINDIHTRSLRDTRLPVILYRVTPLHAGRMFVKYEAGHTAEALDALHRAYKQLEPKFTMRYWFQDETFDELYKTEIISAKLVGIFTTISLIVSIIGVIGLATFNVMRRTKEIGIRRVFGAKAIQILGSLSNEFSVIMIIAALISTPVAWYTADHWLTTFAYHAPMPWWMFIAAFGSISGLTIGIIWLQSIRTVRMNPTDALRSE